jgi:3-hydroxyisobutyrate dehydrogenase
MTISKGIGFIGIGTMGEPMARNLLRSGVELVVWNRTAEHGERLAREAANEKALAAASVARDAAEVFAQCETIILMLADGTAIDSVLARGTPEFAGRVAGRRLVSMGTFSPGYSEALATEIRRAGGRYVEAPVSGSRKPAEAGQLIAMLAGDAEDLAAVRPLLAAMCRECFDCGPVPAALRMKLAVNVFLITMVTGLAEAAHFAGRHGLDMPSFMAILNAGPMASDVSRIKIAKLVQRDFARQAGITDVLKNSRLVIEAAREAEIASPLMDACFALYGETEGLGLGEEDMAAVVKALEKRTAQASGQRLPFETGH